MKAAMLKGIEDLNYGDYPSPEPGPGEILIRVRACAVCATDVKIYHHGHRLIEFPRITGHEVSGEVLAAGAETAGFQPGDRVQVAAAVPCGECYYCLRGLQSMCDNLTAVGYHYDGGFAEMMLVPARLLRNACVNILPGNISYREASLAEPLACVINGQEISGVGFGETVLVIGAGPIGCLHAQLARIRGAARVILADVDPGRLDAAAFTGADRFVNPASEDLPGALREMNEGRLADQVMVAAGSGAAQVAALQAVAKRGTVNLFGGLPKDRPTVTMDTNVIHYGESRLVGTHGSAPRHNTQALQVLASGAIDAKKYISGTFPLADIRKALEAAEARAGLKIIVEPAG